MKKILLASAALIALVAAANAGPLTDTWIAQLNQERSSSGGTQNLRSTVDAAVASLAELEAGGGGGSVSVTAANASIVITPSPGTGTFTIGSTFLVDARTTTSEAIVAGDAGKLVTFNNGSATAVSILQAVGTFGAGWSTTVQNRGAGTVTITPATSTINGAATLTLAQNTGCEITSDGTNYQVSSCTAIGSAGGSFNPTITSVAQGDVLYYNGSAWINLATGTSGQFLTSGGAGANLSWTTSSSTGCPTAGCTFTGAIISAAANTPATPAVAIGAADTGFYRSGANLIDVTIGGTKRWEFTASVLQSVTSGGASVGNAASNCTSGIAFTNKTSAGTYGWSGTTTSDCVIVGSAAASTWTTAGTFLNIISSDAAVTDTTVCQDSTTHQVYSGSGTLGICLGTSSRRYKTNIEYLAGASLDAIMRLRPASYFYKSGHGHSHADGRKDNWLIAEDVSTILPQCVPLDREHKPMSVDPICVQTFMLKAMQEQQREIATLSLQKTVAGFGGWGSTLFLLVGAVLGWSIRRRFA